MSIEIDGKEERNKQKFALFEEAVWRPLFSVWIE